MKLISGILLSILLSVCVSKAHAANSAFGRPGIVPNWSSAKKIHVGTSFPEEFKANKKPKSLVWFTMAGGILTETYYPTIDKAQIKDSQILISNGTDLFHEEKTSLKHSVEVISASHVKMINSDPKGQYKISHEYYSLNNKSVVVDKITINTKIDGLKFYLLVNPALNNTGYKDNAYAAEDALIFKEENTILKVQATTGFEKTSVGYVGHSDGYQDLNRDFKMDYNYKKAIDGNVAGTAKLNVPSKAGNYVVYVTYDFTNSKSLVAKSLEQELVNYNASWNQYLNNLQVPKNLSKDQKDLFLRSLYVLRVHEDKLIPGALVASLSKPWGEETYEHPGVFTGGYHLVWPRDLYHVSTALLNTGDEDTALRALNYLKRIQYKAGTWNYGGRVIKKKGAWPQNVWTYGGEYWGGYQLDQTGYPVQLFYQLYKKANVKKKQELIEEFSGMVLDATEFIKKYGPWSAQERWEENFGISPSSFSAATAALIQMDEIFPGHGFKTTAHGWLYKPQDNIHTWTFTNTGMYGDGQYYLRVAGCDSHLGTWNPNADVGCTIANSGQRVGQKAILDQGFLKLSLMGLVSAGDWRINASLEKVNKHIRVKTPNGYGWYRYSYDAYGENKKGRLWPLLSSEHGRFEIEKHNAGVQSWQDTINKINPIIKSYLGFANAGNMLPEQVFESTGEGTGAATPLAWSHAEYVKLLWSVDKKHNVENLLD